MVDRIKGIPFKFEVGQIIKHKLGGRYIILERSYHECYNTFQLHYLCRVSMVKETYDRMVTGAAFPDKSFLLNEIELEEIVEKESEKTNAQS